MLGEMPGNLIIWRPSGYQVKLFGKANERIQNSRLRPILVYPQHELEIRVTSFELAIVCPM